MPDMPSVTKLTFVLSESFDTFRCHSATSVFRCLSVPISNLPVMAEEISCQFVIKADPSDVDGNGPHIEDSVISLDTFNSERLVDGRTTESLSYVVIRYNII